MRASMGASSWELALVLMDLAILKVRATQRGGGWGAISETQVTSAATPLLLPLTAKRGDAHVDDADTTAAGLLSARPHLNGISHIVGGGGLRASKCSSTINQVSPLLP